MSDADAVSASGARFVTAATAAIGDVLTAVVDVGNGPLVWVNDGAGPDRGEGWRETSGRSDALVTGRVAGTDDLSATESGVELDVNSDVTS